MRKRLTKMTRCFFQILEVENDSKMKRTKRRPLPLGCITTEHAIAWGLTTGIGGIALLASQVHAYTQSSINLQMTRASLRTTVMDNDLLRDIGAFCRQI